MADWSVLAPAFKPVGARRESTLTDPGCVIDHFVVSPELRSLLNAAPEVYAFDEDPAFLDAASPDARVWKRTTDHRPVTLTITSDDPAAPAGPGPLKLTLLSTEELPGTDFSGVVSLGDGTLLLAHDDDGIYRWRPGSAAVLLRGKQDHDALGDIESLCYDELTRKLYTLSEDEGVLLSFDVVPGAEATLSPAHEEARLDRHGDTENKGWEGVALLPARFRKDGVARLIAVNEGAPKAVAVYALPGLERRATVELSGELDAALGDVADVAVCPDTGNLLLLSDQSEVLAEVELAADDRSLRMISLHRLPVANKAKPEGLAVTADGQLLVVTDQSKELLRFAMGR
ncbi:MAG: SdiA-regulated domain-containing protein [Polyangiales bacterium]